MFPRGKGFTCKSLRRNVVNYAPTALAVIGFVAYLSGLAYDWINFASYSIGASGVLSVVLAFFTFVVAVSGRSPESIGEAVYSVGWAVTVCRTACILWHSSLVLLLVHLLAVLPIAFVNADYMMFGMALNTASLCSCYILVWYRWYWSCWYEKAVIAQNEKLYGSTVFVSVPVFKCCGHFVLVVRDHKYELRLNATAANRPIFNQRPLRPGEMNEIREQFGHDWFIVGWTRRKDSEIQVAFADAIQSFGVYDRLYNNCRHFLQHGSWRILDTTSSWHRDFLESRPIFVTLYSIWVFMHREFYRWMWARRFGPGWEDRSVAEYEETVKGNDEGGHRTGAENQVQDVQVRLLHCGSVCLGIGLLGALAAIIMLTQGISYDTTDLIFVMSEMLSVIGCLLIWWYAFS
ncbi:hypothetical protein BV22DRAFT_1124317 [Leucogyrophana mollusca]|uniref:Uncharacterized protein n=1 Tax=Leucogyrophana mollusca TaxID=85980 RepID=A0ACB8C1Z0_9AGAM|nr:hypothetical protein BV22DRAFT_1124317 [Leucogyrophana mollusca]